MFGIGAFARVAQVSVRTLHHYDDVGLLPPAQVDPQAGYRWYRADQLQRLNRILALRDLGLPLTEVRKVVDDEVSLDELRGMLRLRQAEATERMAAEAERLSRLRPDSGRSRWRDARASTTSSSSPRGAARRARGHHPRLVRERPLARSFDRLFGELHGELDRKGVAAAGPHIALYEPSEDRPRRSRSCTAADRRRRRDLGPGSSRRPARRRPGGGHGPPRSMARIEDGYRADALGGRDGRADRRVQPRGLSGHGGDPRLVTSCSCAAGAR